MSGEHDRKQAIVAGASEFSRAFHATKTSLPDLIRINTGIAALLAAGWIPPRQHNQELAQVASWQRDARRAFAVVEKIADDLDADGFDGAAARALRDALGEQFLTPREASE